MKIVTVCGHGLGSSFMVEMNINKALSEFGLDDIEVSHSDLGSVTNADADIFVVGKDLADATSSLDNVITLDTLIDYPELKTKLEAALKEKGKL
ncbi:MAG: PTS sugar transporter subunit IIB [Bifidobacteriaceae bacterium]|jgi:PTS system ascorbate-specific IIB component|nr:PTS sugar transporter subunit IIB [Bifidobacteriaceae bacterium]